MAQNQVVAANFAQEASPALNREATIMMAKSMLKNKNLYLLKNESNPWEWLAWEVIRPIVWLLIWYLRHRNLEERNMLSSRFPND